MTDRSQYTRISPDQVRNLKFRTISPQQARAIKERIRNISRGGIILETTTPLSIDTIVEVTYQPDLGGRTVEAVGIVRWIDSDLPGGGIQFLRVTSPEGTSQRGAKSDSIKSARLTPRRKSSTNTTFIPARDIPAPGTPAATTVFTDGPILVITGEFGPTAYNGFVDSWAQTLKAPSDRLLIDLTKVMRIASMGVGLLVGAHMDALKLGKSVTIKAPVTFQRLFAVAGVDKVLHFVYVEGNEENAGLDDWVGLPAGTPKEEIGQVAAGTLADDGEIAPELAELYERPDPVAEAEAALQRELAEFRLAQEAEKGAADKPDA